MVESASATAARSRPTAPSQGEFSDAGSTFARILDAIGQHVYRKEIFPDGHHELVFSGPCRERFLGLSHARARTATWAEYVHRDDLAAFDSAHLEALTTGQVDLRYRLIGADGVERWVRDRGRVRVEGDRRYLDGCVLDVTTMQAVRNKAEAARAAADQLARTDALTGVPNRRLLPELFERFAGVPLGLLSIDVDRFKLVNDLHGHVAGDVVLGAIADRLTQALRADDHVVRMGGEEFLMLLPGLDDAALLHDLADRIRGFVADTPIDAGALSMRVTVSIGATLAPVVRDVDALLVAADRLLYAAKRAGRNRVEVASDGPGAVVQDEGSELFRVAIAVAITAGSAAGGVLAERYLAVSRLAGRVATLLELQEPQVLRCRLSGVVGELDDDVLAAIPDLAQLGSIVRHRHERYDGTGLPDGLSGDEIPLEARIVVGAATLCALVAGRDRAALTQAEALAEMERAAGTRLDPVVVDATRRALG